MPRLRSLAFKVSSLSEDCPSLLSVTVTVTVTDEKDELPAVLPLLPRLAEFSCAFIQPLLRALSATHTLPELKRLTCAVRDIEALRLHLAGHLAELDLRVRLAAGAWIPAVHCPELALLEHVPSLSLTAPEHVLRELQWLAVSGSGLGVCGA